MAMKQLIYASRPFGFDQGGLNAILSTARRKNSEREITGALICRADIYLQLLEGPAEAIAGTYARIKRDDRHLEVTLISEEDVEARLFPKWSMLDDPARSWIWSQEEVAAGVMSSVTPAAVRAVFVRLAEEPHARADEAVAARAVS